MRTLHIVPGAAAEHSLSKAIKLASRDDKVMAFPDDLSCGPIKSHDPSARAAWWDAVMDDVGVERRLREFWKQAENSHDRFVIWFGRHSALEYSFFLAWAEQIGTKQFSAVDVTDFVFRPLDGTSVGPARWLGAISPKVLLSLLGRERPVPTEEVLQAATRWRELRAEDAPFRVVINVTGLLVDMVSRPVIHFDASILEQCRTEWIKVIVLIAKVLAVNVEPYVQVGSAMIQMRIAHLVIGGRLLADGDLPDFNSCSVRLP